MKHVIIIGSGFAGMSAACFLAKAGVHVTVLEKQDTPGGRGRAFAVEGFTFDMGPSWYWMPDVFEHFFSQFGKTAQDYYDLQRLDPSYRVVWGDETKDIPADMDRLKALFESYEKGAGLRLTQFLQEAGYKYHAAMEQLVYKPGLSIFEFARWDVLKAAMRLDLLESIHTHVRRFFKHPKLLQLAEFPILFLGALPQNTPALYSLMNYADMQLGTWYPMGGMAKIGEAMHSLAASLGVEFLFGKDVTKIEATNSKATGVIADGEFYAADAVIAACDYHHADQHLLDKPYRNYSTSYWESRKMAPSCLLYYIGLNKRVDNLQHHNLFFDAPFEAHADALYKDPQYPQEPLMYICCPSKTDASVAPEGCENIFILIPVAPGMKEDEAIREHYFNIAINRIEQRTGQSIREAIIYKRSYAGADFMEDYNAFKGNAYGLSNTLSQTAVLKPSIRNKKLNTLYYTGQLTVPGPGVPPALISGEIVAAQLLSKMPSTSQTPHQHDLAIP